MPSVIPSSARAAGQTLTVVIAGCAIGHDEAWCHCVAYAAGVFCIACPTGNFGIPCCSSRRDIVVEESLARGNLRLSRADGGCLMQQRAKCEMLASALVVLLLGGCARQPQLSSPPVPAVQQKSSTSLNLAWARN